MDIQCPTCGEPWDSDHIRHDEAHEWNLDASELAEILKIGRFAGPDDRIREAARAAGWEFATDSLLSFIQCPCCKPWRKTAGPSRRCRNCWTATTTP